MAADKSFDEAANLIQKIGMFLGFPRHIPLLGDGMVLMQLSLPRLRSKPKLS